MASRAIRLPRNFKSTHETAGLPNFPSVDVFGQPGEQVFAPAAGNIVDVHQIPWDVKKRVGGGTAYLQTPDQTYFLTHLDPNITAGPVQANQPIGTLAAVPNNAWAPHVHEGLHQGLYQPGGGSVQTLPYRGGGTGSQTLPYTGGGTNVSPLAQALARYPQLDSQAVMAVAAQEGLGGGIGDNGTSFGPFQLHYGGAYPSSAPRGTPAASQAWAWSPEGINYALQRIAGVAGGQRGAQAVGSIVHGFERPADPATEVAKALAAYGKTPAGGGYSGGGSPAQAAPAMLAAQPQAPARLEPIKTALQQLVNQPRQEMIWR